MCTHPKPLAHADLYEQALRTAGHLCRCTGQCGKPHPAALDGECRKAGTSARPLTAAPADPTIPLHQAVTLDAADLTAWCSACYSTARKRPAQPAAVDEDFMLFAADDLS